MLSQKYVKLVCMKQINSWKQFHYFLRFTLDSISHFKLYSLISSITVPKQGYTVSQSCKKIHLNGISSIQLFSYHVYVPKWNVLPILKSEILKCKRCPVLKLWCVQFQTFKDLLEPRFLFHRQQPSPRIGSSPNGIFPGIFPVFAPGICACWNHLPYTMIFLCITTARDIVTEYLLKSYVLAILKSDLGKNFAIFHGSIPYLNLKLKFVLPFI